MDDKTYQQITWHTERGNALADAEEYRDAFKEFVQAYELIPAPKEDYEATTWVLAAMGDCYFFLGSYAQARDAFQHAVACPGGLGNPFVHLRLGQAQFELGNRERAADELARAYMGAGSEIFAEEDAKYLEFLRTVMDGI